MPEQTTPESGQGASGISADLMAALARLSRCEAVHDRVAAQLRADAEAEEAAFMAVCTAEDSVIKVPCHSVHDIIAKLRLAQRWLDGPDDDVSWARHNAAMLRSMLPLLQEDGHQRAKYDLVRTIEAYRRGIVDFNARASEIAEGPEIAAVTYQPHFEALEAWQTPADSMDAAIEALRLARHELELDALGGPALPMVRAALGFLEGRPAC